MPVNLLFCQHYRRADLEKNLDSPRTCWRRRQAVATTQARVQSADIRPNLEIHLLVYLAHSNVDASESLVPDLAGFGSKAALPGKHCLVEGHLHHKLDVVERHSCLVYGNYLDQCHVGYFPYSRTGSHTGLAQVLLCLVSRRFE